MSSTIFAELKKSRRLLLLSAVFMLLVAAWATDAKADSCRDWSQEHWAIKSDVVRLYLSSASQETLDAAVFELLQREAYMTSCDPKAVVDRAHQVGWRMLERDPDEYGAVVIEALLADAGLDLSLAGLFQVTDLESVPAPPTTARRSTRRSTRLR